MESGETIFRLAICLVLWRLVRSVDFARTVPGGPLEADTIPSASGVVDNLPGRIFDALGKANLWLSAQASLSVISGSAAVIPMGLALECVRKFAKERDGLSLLPLCQRSSFRVRPEYL